MKKWIPNEMLTDEPQEGEKPNSFQKMIFGLGEESVIRDPVTKNELEVNSDVVAKNDGKYVMRFSVESERETVKDKFDDKFMIEKSLNIDVPLEVIGNPSKPSESQILFDIDKGIDVYESAKTYDTVPLSGKKGDLVSETKNSIPDALEKEFMKFAKNLENSIREVGFDVFDTNIVKEVAEPKSDKKPKDSLSPSM